MRLGIIFLSTSPVCLRRRTLTPIDYAAFQPSIVHLSASYAGGPALDALKTAPLLSVMGVTSRGIFLRAGERRVVFLSRESFRGPLTVNLSGPSTRLDKLQVGDAAVSQEGTLFFPSRAVSISLTAAPHWAPPPAPAPLPKDLPKRLSAAAGDLYSLKRGRGLSDLLPHLLHAPNPPRLTPELGQVWSRLSDVKTAPMSRVAEDVHPMLGWGSGLTPSGDDFLAGLALVFARWPGLLPPDSGWPALLNDLVQAAFRRTTTLSASLLELAAVGQADERLILAADHLLCGLHTTSQAVEALAGWGNSSGADALLGMALAIELSRRDVPAAPARRLRRRPDLPPARAED